MINRAQLNIIIAIATYISVCATPVSAGTPKRIGNDVLIIEEIDAVDKLHQKFSSNLHTYLTINNTFSLTKYKTIKQLNYRTNEFINNKQPVAAANLIVRHIPMLKDNYDNLAIFNLISILLGQNELTAANRILAILKKEGDKTLYSNAVFYFSKYYFSRNKWNKVLGLLDGTINDLAAEEYHYALLMKGIALQHKQKHRKAIKEYTKIPPTSNIYLAARLNIAIANIRQGWWTDAHTIINKALKTKAIGQQEEAINRFYLTLGYSLLHKEYYRNSRKAFRNIGLKSQYTNKALLGIALSAANQEDYIGALNATRILKRENTFDLPVEESRLLVPYFYEKLQKHTTASAGYAEAVTYYDQRISRINELLGANTNLYKYGLNINEQSMVNVDSMALDLSMKYPAYLLSNYPNLTYYENILDTVNNQTLKKEFENLQNKYLAIFRSMIGQILRERIKHLNSYKDQSRYGLARLYDHNLPAK